MRYLSSRIERVGVHLSCPSRRLGGRQNGPPLCGVRRVAADQAEQFYAAASFRNCLGYHGWSLAGALSPIRSDPSPDWC
jgi:hypothetical protein